MRIGRSKDIEACEMKDSNDHYLPKRERRVMVHQISSLKKNRKKRGREGIEKQRERETERESDRQRVK